MPIFIILILGVIYWVTKKNKKDRDNVISTRKKGQINQPIKPLFDDAVIVVDEEEDFVPAISGGNRLDADSTKESREPNHYNDIFDEEILPEPKVERNFSLFSPRYMSNYDSKNGCFQERDVKEEMTQYSYFLMEQFADNLAQYKPIDDPVIQENAIKAFRFILGPVCVLAEESNLSGKSIEVVNPGLIRREDDRWFIVEDEKCEIRIK